jgi:uncharacterized membrane protein
LFFPIAWGLSWQNLAPLIGAVPNILLNVLSVFEYQKDLNHHYSLPILPFLLLMVMSSFAQNRTWLFRSRRIILWCLICFLFLGRPAYFAIRYLDEGLRTVRASHIALRLIEDERPVLVPSHIVPHVTHRLTTVTMLTAGQENIDLSFYDYVFLDTDYPGALNSLETVQNLRDRLQDDRAFALIFNRNQVYLFARQ